MDALHRNAMTLTRGLIDDLTVMNVMEDWCGLKMRIAGEICWRWDKFSDDEILTAVEALSLLYPRSVFVAVDKNLGMRIDEMISLSVKHLSRYTEMQAVNSLKTTKDIDRHHTKHFQSCIRDAIARGVRFAMR